MSTHPVLDLDDDPDPDRGDEHVWWREARVPLWAVIPLLLAVGALAAGATRAWDRQQAGLAGPQAVQVLVSIPADNGLIGSGDGTTVTLRSAVQVINTGRQPITLEAVASISTGVALIGDGDGRAVPAGAAGQVVVRGSISCQTWVSTEPIELRLDIRDVDGVLHPTVKTLVIQGTWDELLSTC